MTGGERYYLAADVRELDRLAIEAHHIPGFTLMQRAGNAAFRAMVQQWPDLDAVLSFCGGGNNGGDGYVIAALAAQKGLRAKVIAVSNPANLSGDANKAWELAVSNAVEIESFDDFISSPYDRITNSTVLVDAMLGTGLTGEVRGLYQQAIRWINNSRCHVLAADIPSGLCSDTGKILGEAVAADLTVTFIGRKLGQVIGEGPITCGKLAFDDLDVPDEIYNVVSPATP